MENVPAIGYGEKKLLQIPSNSITYSELERKLRDRFRTTSNDVAIYVENQDGEKYRIQDDEDLEPLRKEMKRLHIESSSKPFSEAVVVARQDHQLQNVFEGENPLKSSVTNMCGAVDMLQLITIAGNVQGARLHDLEKEVYDTIVSLAEICQDANVFYVRCYTTCDNVLKTVEVAAGFHAEGHNSVAMKTLSSLANVSSDRGSQCTELCKKVDDAIKKTRGIQEIRAKKVGEMESNLDGRKQLSMEKRKQEIEKTRAVEALHEAVAGVNERKETYSVDKKRAHNTTLSSLVTFGLAALKAGTALSGVAAVGVPAVLIGATTYVVHACGKQVTAMNTQQLADETMLEERRNEVAEAKKAMLDLTYKLENLESVNVEDILETLHQVEKQLRILQSVLLEMKRFWDLLASTFFPTQQSVEEKFDTYSKVQEAAELRQVFGSSSFEQMLKPYLEYWVLFREHCRESEAAVKCNIEPLHELMKRNLTPDEALRMLPDRARAIREEQSTDSTTDAIAE